jgi:Xaa-Pro aminopeptidase
VHEGPIGIGTRVQYTEVPIAPGNVISDGRSFVLVICGSELTVIEPGFYEDGKFGIRIESESLSLAQIVPRLTPYHQTSLWRGR